MGSERGIRNSEHPGEWEAIPLRSFATTAWRHRRLLLIILVVCPLLAIGVTFLQPTLYTARATLLPQESPAIPRGMFGGFLGLESLGLGGAGQEDLYAQIVVSDRLLDPLLQQKWTLTGHAEPVSLMEFLAGDSRQREEPDPALREFRLKDFLRTTVISFRKDKLTDFMILSVTLPESPQMAANVANFLVTELERYNTEVLQSEAAEQRRFIEKRLVEVQRALFEAEDALVTFQEVNRSFEASPELMRTFSRLQREIEVQSTIWSDLRRQLESVKIDEVRDRVRLNILDRAEPPVMRSSPNRRLMAVSGALLGIVLAAATVVTIRVRDSIVRADRPDPPTVRA